MSTITHHLLGTTKTKEGENCLGKEIHYLGLTGLGLGLVGLGLTVGEGLGLGLVVVVGLTLEEGDD